jgi:hypothetical protein
VLRPLTAADDVGDASRHESPGAAVEPHDDRLRHRRAIRQRAVTLVLDVPGAVVDQGRVAVVVAAESGDCAAARAVALVEDDDGRFARRSVLSDEERNRGNREGGDRWDDRQQVTQTHLLPPRKARGP